MRKTLANRVSLPRVCENPSVRTLTSFSNPPMISLCRDNNARCARAASMNKLSFFVKYFLNNFISLINATRWARRRVNVWDVMFSRSFWLSCNRIYMHLHLPSRYDIFFLQTLLFLENLPVVYVTYSRPILALLYINGGCCHTDVCCAISLTCICILSTDRCLHISRLDQKSIVPWKMSSWTNVIVLSRVRLEHVAGCWSWITADSLLDKPSRRAS